MRCRIPENQNILQLIAEKNHVSVEEVRREIDEAIAQARQSSDPAVQSVWTEFLREYLQATAEQVIYYFADLLKVDAEV